MKKILNDNTEHVVEEMLKGFTKGYNKYYEKLGELNAVRYRNHRKNKVALVIGGGSGHEPLFPGFAGKGLADAAACGNICASPNPQLIAGTARSVEQGKGVLFVYGCYEGDNLNFDMAEEILSDEGIKTAHVRVWDDCVSAPPDRIQDRRGIAGDVFVIKIAGAACDAGLELDEVKRVVEKARDCVSSIGLATSPGTLPGNDRPVFELGCDEIEFGMGLHGEPGIERSKMQSADQLTYRMYCELKKEMKLKAGDEVAVLVNGLGSTTLLELCVVSNRLHEILENEGVLVYDAELKTYCTCQDMGGFSISIFRLDEELRRYYDMPCFSPYYAKGL